jgi:uncharacterized repeat protein (TIGR01451 family)
MKQFYFYSILILSVFSANAQVVNIPDANFKNALVNTICADLNDDGVLESDVDTDNDGEIQQSEALAVFVLFYVPPPPLFPTGEFRSANITNNIANLTGIEAFLNVKKLDVSDNLLTALDVSMLTQLNILRCGSNDLNTLQIGSLPSLEYLYCENNHLTSISLSGVPNLKLLACNINNLTELDVNGLNALSFLSCYNNQITQLTFGNSHALRNLYCGNNFFEMLDLNDTAVSLLYCNDNPNLSQIFLKNGVNSPFETPQFPFPIPTFSFSNTPMLQFICVDDDEINAIVLSLNGQNVNVNSYCNFTLGGNYNTVSGNVNLNCGGSNTNLSGVKVKISDGTNEGLVFTDNDGHYTFFAGTQTVTVSPELENSDYFAVTPANYTFAFATSGNSALADFCISSNGVHPDLEISILPLVPARPGSDATYKINYRNKGTELLSGDVILNFDDAVLDFISATPNIDSQSANTLSWNFTSLAPFESREITFTVNVNSPMEIPAVNNGDILTFNTQINVVQTDETPADNTFTFSQTVIGSFDPNDKAVSKSVMALTALDEYLVYTVRFQNTGTAAAENVVVKDMLSSKLNLSTLQIVSSSHSYRATLTSGNKLEFFFEGINLPAESQNEPLSHGYISFKIKPKNNLVLNDIIENTAEIYFDFNFPVVTNTVSTSVSALGTGDFTRIHFSLYPNPAYQTVVIHCENNMPFKDIKIYNMLGQLVKTIQRNNSDNEIIINISDLLSGNYFVILESPDMRITKKLIKW